MPRMNEKWQQLIDKLRLRAGGSATTLSGAEDVVMHATRSKLLPAILLALLAAFLACLVLEGILASQLLRVQNELAAAIGKRQPSIFMAGAAKSTQSAKISFNAFDVVETNPANVEKKEEEGTTEAKPIEDFKLIGTLPRIAAWVQADKNTTLVLRSQEFNGYVLEMVEPGRVLFSRDDEFFPLYLVYSAQSKAAPARQASAPPQQTQQQPEQQQAPGNPAIVNAEFNGNEGTVTRELLNELLMNPYGEIAKIRLVPHKDGNGMVIRSMRSDSLFAQLGVKQGDVLTGINGIPIKDASSMVNVISSMLTGARMDLDVQRGNEAGKLPYAVK